MDKEVLRTDVDDFIELIQKRNKISIREAAKLLGVPDKTIEMWTDFLVEERILDTEYKFTTQYIFLNTSNEGNVSSGHYGIDTKQDFFDKAREKKISENKIKLLWLKYLSQNEEKIKNIFMKKAKAKGLSIEKMNKLWEKYYTYLKV